MKITNDTEWSEIEKDFALFSDESQQTLIQHSLSLHNVTDFYELTIAQLIRMSDGDLSEFEIKDNGKVFEVLFVRELSKFVEQYINILNSYTLPQSADEKAASAKCQTMTFGEGVLVFARSYFALHSFGEAERITLAELLLAKKDAYNSAVFQKEIIKLQSKRKK